MPRIIIKVVNLINKKFKQLLGYWRFFFGMFIGGFLGGLIFAWEDLKYFLEDFWAVAPKHDIYLGFIGGLLGIGIVIGGLWQWQENKKD